ncbi:MAG: TIGR03936 family radical SAM-associated protein [Clostridia bacterium]|nr:TIGR03936 family radical SAM-associated protein [Clostridia bacterium]
MVKYRFCYSKFGDAKYISHLDLIRLFSRAFKRAHIPLTYSEGFNPHPKMAIGLPLSVGITSEGEYVDAEVDRTLSIEDFENLNRAMPLGICINQAAELVLGMQKLADIRWAVYTVTVSGSTLSESQVKDFLARESVIVEKKTKRKVEDADILPDIAEIALLDAAEDGVRLSMTLSAGPAANLKPELVLVAMSTYIDGFRAEDFAIHRVKILSDKGRTLL